MANYKQQNKQNPEQTISDKIKSNLVNKLQSKQSKRIFLKIISDFFLSCTVPLKSSFKLQIRQANKKYLHWITCILLTQTYIHSTLQWATFHVLEIHGVDAILPIFVKTPTCQRSRCDNSRLLWVMKNVNKLEAESLSFHLRVCTRPVMTCICLIFRHFQA